MTMPPTNIALNMIEDEAIKAAETMKVDPTPLALYLILKDWRDKAKEQGKTEYSISLLEIQMITCLKRELNDAGL